MKIILREDIKGKGAAGDIIDVKSGFARNYLIPKDLAFLATNANMKIYEHERVIREKANETKRSEAGTLKAELEKISLTAAVKVGEDDRLFGSVTNQTVSDLLKEQGHDINHRKIIIDEPIKELGVFEAKVAVFQDIDATIKVWVVKE